MIAYSYCPDCGLFSLGKVDPSEDWLNTERERGNRVDVHNEPATPIGETCGCEGTPVSRLRARLAAVTAERDRERKVWGRQRVENARLRAERQQPSPPQSLTDEWHRRAQQADHFEAKYRRQLEHSKRVEAERNALARQLETAAYPQVQPLRDRIATLEADVAAARRERDEVRAARPAVPFAVCAYECSVPGAHGPIRIEHCGPEADRWAVRIGPWCLNRDQEWEFEPQPSSRDAEFFGRCRWTLAEAVDVLLAMGARG